MTENAIETKQLTYSYGKKKNVVKDLNIKVEKGKIYSFLGPNGAGKSTTIKLLLGLLHARQGDIAILNYDQSKRISINQHIGVLVESPGLYEHLSGKANLKLQADLRGVSKERVSEVLKQVEMEHAANAKVKTYSTGMKQRIGLAAAMLQKPELLILDEPTNGLDPKGIREIRDLLINLNRELGITIFLSTHLLSEAERLSHRIGIIQQGKLVFQGSRKELQNMKSSAVRAWINTDDNEKAADILGKDNNVEKHEDGYLLVDCTDEKQVADFTRTLVNEKLNVYHASVYQADLEEMFLNLTKDE
ncbi:MAG: ABC transporter ATP-binding protein [Bacteroidota bacterium]